MQKRRFTKCERDMPIKITVNAFRKPSNSLPKWWKFAGVNGFLAPTKKVGDADNILKLLFDAMTEVVYEDDAQIFSVSYECRYAEKARTEIKVEAYYVNIGAVREQAEALMPKPVKKKENRTSIAEHSNMFRD